MSRKQRGGTAIRRSNSAALGLEDAKLPDRGGGCNATRYALPRKGSDAVATGEGCEKPSLSRELPSPLVSRDPAEGRAAPKVIGIRGAPVGRPAWAPESVDLDKVPEPVRQAVAEIIEPAYRQMVAEAEDPIERSIGLTVVHLMWLEVLDQHEAKHEYLTTASLNLPQDRFAAIDQHLRMLHTKVKVGSFVIQLREMRRRSEAAL